MPTRIEDGARTDDVRELLDALPAWFGIESANAEYVAAADRLPGATARSADGSVAGIVLWERHFPPTWEIHLIAVRPGLHRQGVGRRLVEHVATLAGRQGAALLEVKTLGPSNPDAGYARTREFYLSLGFLPVEELHELWGENPCLVMVRPLR